MSLTERELRRYSRQLLLPEVGLAGQERLRAARIVCIGAGGLGCPALLYLAAAGVGRITVVDHDRVDESNLQRQVLFCVEDVGKNKATAAAARLHERNPHVEVLPLPIEATAENLLEILRDADLVIDATDRFETRYLISDAAVLTRTPLVFASVFRFEGQISVLAGDGGPCYRCIFPEPPPVDLVPSCADGGVFGMITGLVGMHQGTEALKILLDIGETLVGRMLFLNALSGSVREIPVEKRPDCPVCGDAPTITSVAPIQREELRDARLIDISPEEFDEMRERPGTLVIDAREPHEAPLGPFPNALVLPASQVATRLHELDVTANYIVACRVGQRSIAVGAKLLDAGFRKVFHLTGGFLAYDAYQSGAFLTL